MRHDRRPASSSGLELTRLIWPSLTERDLYHGRKHCLLVEYITSIVDDLEHGRFRLPPEGTKLAIESVVAARGAVRSRVIDIVRASYVYTAEIDEDTKYNIPEEAAKLALQRIAQVWAMLDIRFQSPSYGHPAHEPIVWHDDELITDVTHRFFQQKAENSHRFSEPSRTIDADLTAARLVIDHGVRIVWTWDIADHLSITRTRKTTTLKVFEHKVWAQRHLRNPHLSPIPQDVLEELLRTHNLLFPNFLSETKSLLRRYPGMIDSFHSLGTCGVVSSHDWADYRYWRRELHQLSEILYEPPRGLRQLWTTRRNEPNILNLVLFWVSGVAVAMLTIVACVCGVLSVTYAIESRDLAIASRDIAMWQLQLDLVQACEDEGQRHKLPPPLQCPAGG
ncbi:hypothetical protein QBC34DRAFT_469292 [Podospora aff. communis PSN243]|uniref:Uncharacterized protein n=1 Tax=Podospora aff. communis PSN243 TaxID=3040156 RepID=A0AAV9GFS8_9PEZI|nr:hypothetical protein QBC34DRAFT_469292 [Podospora aff. communis PSN243]